MLIQLSGYTAFTLPNPDWGDVTLVTGDLHVHKMMSGYTRTYVRNPGVERIEFSISNLYYSTYKALITYLNQNETAAQILTSWDGTTSWTGYIVTNPIQFTANIRGSSGSPCTSDDIGSISLVFEGVRNVS